VRQWSGKWVQNFNHKTRVENDLDYLSADEKLMLNSSFKGWNVS
jgi:hypothetical protein